MRDLEPGYRRCDAGGRVCFCSDHGSVVNAMKACDPSPRWWKPPSPGAPAVRHACPMLTPMTMPSECSLLKGLHPATTPGKIPPPRFRSVGQTVLWQKLVASRCCSAPRHLFGVFAEARTRRHRPSSLSLPTPLKISDAVDCLREDILSRNDHGGNPVFVLLAQQLAPGKRTRPWLHSPPEHAPGAVRCHPAAHQKCRANAGGTLRAQIFTFSTSSPQCLPPGSLAQTRVPSGSSIAKTVMVRPKTPKNPVSRKPGCCPGAAVSRPLPFSGLFCPRKPGCCTPARVFPDPARTERICCRREGGSVGYGDSDIGTPGNLGGSGSVISRKNPVRWTCFRKRNPMGAQRLDIGVNGAVCAEHGDDVGVVSAAG